MNAIEGVPDGWLLAPLGEIASFEMGQAPPGDASNFSGDGTLFVKAGEFGTRFPIEREWTTKPLKFGRHGDVFICVVGATAGKINLGIDCAIGRSVAAIRPCEALDSVYLFHQMSARVREFRAASSGSAQGVISRSDLAAIEVAVPPLREQRRIRDKLDELLSDLDAGVAALERARATLKRYRASVLKAAVEGQLTAAWREAHPDAEPASKLLERILAERRKRWEERQLAKFAEAGKAPPKGWREGFPRPIHPNGSPPFELPDGWIWVGLDEILVDQLRNGRSVPTAAEGFPVLRLTALKEDRVELCERKIGAWSRGDAAPFLVREGDFLIARGNGSLRLVGRGALVRDSDASVAFPDTMIRACVSPMGCLPEFLSVVWDSGLVREQIERVARTSAGIYKIAQPDLEQIWLPLPSTNEISRIVEHLTEQNSVLRRNLDVLNAVSLRASRLRQSILKLAFEGRLVPQDPKDESASVLLERIRAAREAGAVASPKPEGARKRRAGRGKG